MRWRQLGQGLCLFGLLIGCVASATVTHFLYRMSAQTERSFELAKESIDLAKKEAELTGDPWEGLRMTYEGLEKLKSEQYNQRWLARWEQEGRQIAQRLTAMNRDLLQMSEQGVREAKAGEEKAAKAQQVGRELIALQRRSVKQARELQALSQKLLPISEALPKLLP